MGLKEKFKQEMRTSVRRYQPWIAAVFNFFIWGLGYIWNRGRMLLGMALCSFVMILFGSAYLFVRTPTLEMLNIIIIAIILAWLFVSTALAIDAYQDSKAILESEKKEK